MVGGYLRDHLRLEPDREKIFKDPGNSFIMNFRGLELDHAFSLPFITFSMLDAMFDMSL